MLTKPAVTLMPGQPVWSLIDQGQLFITLLHRQGHLLLIAIKKGRQSCHCLALLA